MAEPIGNLVDHLLFRVRDYTGLAATRTLCKRLFSQTQRILNGHLRIVAENATFTTTPSQSIYPLSATIPAALRLEAMRDAGRDLAQLKDLTQLRNLSRGWFRDMSSRHTAFLNAGRDLFILYPAVNRAVTLTANYTKRTVDLVLDTDPTELPDEYLPQLSDLTELLILLKFRRLGELDTTMQRFAKRLQADTLSPKYLPTSRNVSGMDLPRQVTNGG